MQGLFAVVQHVVRARQIPYAVCLGQGTANPGYTAYSIRRAVYSIQRAEYSVQFVAYSAQSVLVEGQQCS
eukprot:3529016-Lingulodinium_polyedra.AAC.1